MLYEEMGLFCFAALLSAIQTHKPGSITQIAQAKYLLEFKLIYEYMEAFSIYIVRYNGKKIPLINTVRRISSGNKCVLY